MVVAGDLAEQDGPARRLRRHHDVARLHIHRELVERVSGLAALAAVVLRPGVSRPCR